MDDKQDEIDFLKSQLYDLSYGKPLLHEISAAIALLQENLEGKCELDKDDKILFELIAKNSAKYMKIIEITYTESKQYYGQLDDDTNA